jgi:glycosyltransferase involved in cell wall biosynthesis
LTPSILPEIKKRGLKIVQTVHDSQMICPYHRLYNFQRNSTCTKCVTGSFINCIKDKCFDGSLIKSSLGALESLYYHKMNFYEKHIDHFIFPSEFLSNMVQKKINLRSYEVLPNFSKTVSGIKKSRKNYYLYYGRISKEKGIFELIDLFKDLKLKLVIIGEGDLKKYLLKSINKIDTIKYLGHKTGKELFTYVSNAKFVVQPAVGFENCPMTVIESFAYSTPVIAADHSGFKDLIKHKQTGYLLNFSNIDRVKQQFIEIDKLNPAHFSDNIKSEFKLKFNKEVHISRILNLYNSLLNKK